MMAEQTPLSQFFNDDLVDMVATPSKDLVDSNIHLGHLLQPATMIEDDFDRACHDPSPRSIRQQPQFHSREPVQETRDRRHFQQRHSPATTFSEHVSKRQKTSSAWFGVGDPIYCNFGHIRLNGLYRVESIEEDEVVLRKTWPSEGAGQEERVTVKSTEAKLEKNIWINAKDHPVMPPEH